MKNLAFCFLILLTACASNSENKAEENQTSSKTNTESAELSAGTFYPSLSVLNSSETFALYLPTQFKKESPTQVLLFLEPQGDGKAPLNLYRGLADTFNWVLVGSNSIKNGYNFQTNGEMLNRLILDLNQKLGSVDEIALCGLSGGAKMALVYAMQSSINKVIYCGAVTKIDDRDSLKLLGFAGIQDMNYSDMVAFGLAFKNAKVQNILIEWNGDHRFPDAEVMKDGFSWLSGQEIPNLDKKRPSISEAALIKEQEFKGKYYDAFKTKESLAWWDAEIEKLHQLKSTDPMYSRLLGFIGLACYSYAGQSFQKGDKEAAQYILHIYEKATPDNEDMKAFKRQFPAK